MFVAVVSAQQRYLRLLALPLASEVRGWRWLLEQALLGAVSRWYAFLRRALVLPTQPVWLLPPCVSPGHCLRFSLSHCLISLCHSLTFTPSHPQFRTFQTLRHSLLHSLTLPFTHSQDTKQNMVRKRKIRKKKRTDRELAH